MSVYDKYINEGTAYEGGYDYSKQEPEFLEKELPRGSKQVGSIDELEVYQKTDYYYLVKDNEVVGFVLALRQPSFTEKQIRSKNGLSFKKLIEVNRAFIKDDPSLRGKGYIKKLYLFLASQGIAVMGDSDQYEGARKLWCSLSKAPGYSTSILNLGNYTVTESGVTLSDINDPRVWDGNDDTRLLLTLK